MYISLYAKVLFWYIFKENVVTVIWILIALETLNISRSFRMMVAFHSHLFPLHPKIENQHKAIFTFDLIFKKFRTLLLSPWVGKVKMSFLSSSHSTQGLHDVILVWQQCSQAPVHIIWLRSNCESLLFQPFTHFMFPWHRLKKAMEGKKSIFNMCCVYNDGMPNDIMHANTYTLPSPEWICLHSGKLFNYSEVSWWLSDNLTWKLISPSPFPPCQNDWDHIHGADKQ